MEHTEIRKATTGDLSALLLIESACFKTDKISPTQMRYLLTRAKAVTFVSLMDNVIAGYAMLLLPMLPRPARLYSIAVQQQYRGRKIAKRLMQHAINYAIHHQYSTMRLEVRASQLDVQHLYHQCGFNVVQKLSGYYADGEDGLRMQVTLDDARRTL